MSSNTEIVSHVSNFLTILFYQSRKIICLPVFEEEVRNLERVGLSDYILLSLLSWSDPCTQHVHTTHSVKTKNLVMKAFSYKKYMIKSKGLYSLIIFGIHFFCYTKVLCQNCIHNIHKGSHLTIYGLTSISR